MLTDNQRKAELQQQQYASVVEHWLYTTEFPVPCSRCEKQIHWKSVYWCDWTGTIRAYCANCYYAADTGAVMRLRFINEAERLKR